MRDEAERKTPDRRQPIEGNRTEASPSLYPDLPTQTTDLLDDMVHRIFGIPKLEPETCRKCDSTQDVRKSGYCMACEEAFWADMQPGDGKEWPE